MTLDNARDLLEAFVVDNYDLEQLENLLSEFNLFEAIGAVRQELRHSDFLAFLLDPRQNHGLDDVFLKQLLKQALIGAHNAPLGAVDIDVADMRSAEVWRERKRIDIFVHDPVNRFVCVIENKIGTKEHSNQLQRYREKVVQEFPDCRSVFIYLTPEGDEASDETYLSFSYAEIAKLLDDICQVYQSTLEQDVYTLLTHYTAMLRRHIVSDSEIAELCRKIYYSHKQALDLVFEHRFDLQMEIAGFLEQLVDASENPALFELDDSTNHYLTFCDYQWDEFFKQLEKKGWQLTWENIVYFAFDNAPESLILEIGINLNPEPIRKAIHQCARDNPQIFKQASHKLVKWPVIYRKDFLSKADYQQGNREDLETKIREEWNRFFYQEYPAIQNALLQIEWPDPSEDKPDKSK